MIINFRITSTGLCKYNPAESTLAREFCAMYDDGENQLIGTKSNEQVRYCDTILIMLLYMY